MLKIGVIVGCYEQFVIGYNLSIEKLADQDDYFLEYEQQFSDHSHLGCVRCVASNNLLVASGSTDESLSIFNMKTSTDLGPLQGHAGSVNEIVIPESMGNRILSCGDDGNICVWEVGRKNKGLVRMLKGHKGPINTLAVHPSGKLAMSASKKDGSLRTWNLITGRSAYVKNTKRAQIEYIRWGPNGDYYVTASNRFVQVYDLATAKCTFEWETPQYILAIKFLPLIHSSKKEFIAIGDGAGYISIHEVPSGKLVLRYKAHENRIKDLCGFIPNDIKESSPDEVWLTSICSDGKIKVWRFDDQLLSGSKENDAVKCLLTIDSTARLTCITVWQGAVSKTPKDDATDEIPNPVDAGLQSNFKERVEITYDQNPDSEIENQSESKQVVKKKKTILNGKVKKKTPKPISNDKKTKLQKLRAALKTTPTKEQCSELSNEQSSDSIAKKKRKVKFTNVVSSQESPKKSKKIKVVKEKTQERGRERQRKIRPTK